MNKCENHVIQNGPEQWKNNAIEVIENLRDDEKFWESYRVVIVKYL